MKKIIVIPFNIPWVWSTDYLNQTAFELAKKGCIVVCYLWGDIIFLRDIFKFNKFRKIVRKYSENIYIVTPAFIIPFRRFKYIENLNSSLNLVFLRVLTEIISIYRKCSKKIFWIFDPNLLFIFKFFNKNYYLLYDCVDYFSVGNKKFITQTNKNEKVLAQKADLVVANSQVLQQHLSKYRKNIPLVPQGFRIDGFVVNKNKYIDLKLKHPVIGYVGGINNRLDTTLLLNLIKRNPKWNFVLWGPYQKDLSTGSNRFKEIKEILKLTNVTTGTSIDKDEIPGIIEQFDAGMIPYDISQNFNRYCYPMKLFEFFYLGKPIVSTEILELHRFPDLVKIGKNYQEWQDIIEDLLTKKWPKSKIDNEIRYAKENGWQKKIEMILNYVNV